MKKLVRFIWIFSLVLGVSLNAQNLSLTIYNENRALVREKRILSLKSGTSTISFTNVASRIDPTSVHFKSLTSPEKLTILEQNYEYDLVNADKIMRKYLGENIRLVTKKGEVFDGKLLTASGSNIVIQDENGEIKIIRGDGVEHFDFPELPEGLITRPTLVWLIENQGPGSQQTEISYLTGGINWHAEYVAVVGPEDKNLDIGGWVSIENQSRATYRNAKLKLVAGEVHQIRPETKRYREAGRTLMALKKTLSPQFEEKPFFEYHLYTLQRKTTLKNNQTKQISLFPSTITKTKKIFIYDGYKNDKKIGVYLGFKNSKKDGLGLPLPKGKIRVYKRDTDKALEFIGEDLIDHTPVDENVRIFLGNAFDLVGNRVEKSSKKISEKAREEEYEISLRNHKKEDVKIVVVEHLYGDWKIVKHSYPFVKKDAKTVEFTIPVPAHGKVTLSYTVLTVW